jgi:hypothetical protein
MKYVAVMLVAIAACLACESQCQAQIVQVGYQPVTAYYAPVPVTTYYAPAPVTTYYAPAPVTTVSYQPVARYRTRYRPILGGTVTRVRYGYTPVYTTAMPVVYGY